MIVVIAGSRSITEYGALRYAIQSSDLDISKVIHGGARGVDMMAERWAQENNVPFECFPAPWEDVEGKPGHLVRLTKGGRLYYILAGYERNERMAIAADAGIVLWDGNSGGAKNMYTKLVKHRKPAFLYKIKGRVPRRIHMEVDNA